MLCLETREFKWLLRIWMELLLTSSCLSKNSSTVIFKTISSLLKSLGSLLFFCMRTLLTLYGIDSTSSTVSSCRAEFSLSFLIFYSSLAASANFYFSWGVGAVAITTNYSISFKQSLILRSPFKQSESVIVRIEPLLGLPGRLSRTPIVGTS